jgi:hypothetical protein
MKKLVKDGMVAVLVSRGWGAGWSTWNYEYPEMLFDPEIADLVLNAAGEDDIVALASSKYPDAYLGGVDGLSVQWVPVGTKFRVDEYDGSESLDIMDEMNWTVA